MRQWFMWFGWRCSWMLLMIPPFHDLMADADRIIPILAIYNPFLHRQQNWILLPTKALPILERA